MKSTQELRDAFNRKGLNVGCPSCGRPNPFKGLPEDATAMISIAGSPLDGYQVLCLICEYCGYVRMHFADVLAS